MLYTITSLVTLFSFACLSRARVAPRMNLTSRDLNCPNVGLPGGVYFMFEMGEQQYDKWIGPEEAMDCIKKRDLVEEVSKSKARWVTFNLIGPDGGGYCELFTSNECDENTKMTLQKPEGLKFPE